MKTVLLKNRYQLNKLCYNYNFEAKLEITY